jgi:hypothetical protein
MRPKPLKEGAPWDVLHAEKCQAVDPACIENPDDMRMVEVFHPLRLPKPDANST